MNIQKNIKGKQAYERGLAKGKSMMANKIGFSYFLYEEIQESLKQQKNMIQVDYETLARQSSQGDVPTTLTNRQKRHKAELEDREYIIDQKLNHLRTLTPDNWHKSQVRNGQIGVEINKYEAVFDYYVKLYKLYQKK